MQQTMLILLTFLSLTCNAQALVSNRGKIEAASNEIKSAINTFNTCIVTTDADKCITDIMQSAGTEYKKYLVGGLLFGMDKGNSFSTS
jgi:hypothetical protein